MYVKEPEAVSYAAKKKRTGYHMEKKLFIFLRYM